MKANMPCYRVITNSVKLEASNRSLLKRALELDPDFSNIKLDENGNIYVYHKITKQQLTITNEEVTLRSRTEYISDQIKRDYAKESVREAAEINGLTIEEDENNPWQFEVVRY